MSDDAWDDPIYDWLDDLLARIEKEPGGIRLGDAAIELRATSLGRSLDTFDNDDLARMIDANVGEFEGFGVAGIRDGDDELVDPANATLTTTATILTGRKFSYRIAAAELADRVVSLAGPLGVLDCDIAGRDGLTDGRGDPLDRFASGGHGLTVPDWVDGFAEGRLLTAWREGDQVLFEVIDDGDVATDGATELQAIAGQLHESVTRGVGVDLNHIIYKQICQQPLLFTATAPPIDELLRAKGYTNRGDWWGPADSDWQTPGAAARASKLALASNTYGLQRHAQDALARLNEIWRQWSGFHAYGIGESPEIDLVEIQDIMKIDRVPLAFFAMHEPESFMWIRSASGEARTEDDDRPDKRETALDLLAAELHRGAADSIAALLLTARSLELRGQARSADASYREVLRRYDTNATALAKCMDAAVDASRFDEALRLTRRLFGPGSPNEEELQEYAGAMITAGRNEPCPCGSGRKYKQCHQGVPLLAEPIATRSLIFKLEMFAEQIMLADRYAPGGRRRAQAELVHYPEARDFMVHEGGMLDKFLERRMELLPPGELERLRSWQRGGRDLYEVIEVDRGVGMTLHNLRTGDHHQIDESEGSLDAQVGQYMLLRLETVDGVTTSYGQGVLVPARDRDRVLDIMVAAEIDDLLAWFDDLLNDDG